MSSGTVTSIILNNSFPRTSLCQRFVGLACSLHGMGLLHKPDRLAFRAWRAAAKRRRALRHAG
eukprot:715739-Amphidinium_carterae.1